MAEDPSDSHSSIYVAEGNVDLEVLDTIFKIQEINGEDYLKMLEETSTPTGELNRGKYIRLLIKKCVVEPKDLKIEKLKPVALALLANGIEEMMGLTELAKKKLQVR